MPGDIMSSRLRRWVVGVSSVIAGAVFLLFGLTPLPCAAPSAQVVVPSGTPLIVTVVRPLDSQNARLGDEFQARVASVVAVGGKIVVAEGAQAEGQCVAVRRGDGRPGHLRLTLLGLRDAQGRLLPLETTTLSRWGGRRVKVGVACASPTRTGVPGSQGTPQLAREPGVNDYEAGVGVEDRLVFVLLTPAALTEGRWAPWCP